VRHGSRPGPGDSVTVGPLPATSACVRGPPPEVGRRQSRGRLACSWRRSPVWA